jgi:magnesium chelatase family protein
MRRYQMKVSGPLLDRVDLVVSVSRAGLRDPLPANHPAGVESSAVVRSRVLAAVARQQARAGLLNARLDAAGLRDHCHLQADAQALLEMAGNRFALSARALDSARRVARTLADLSGDEVISRAHLAEALSLRADRGKAG